ncbi:MAG: beta-propeller domain-containing protein [Candidatus Buchananbacteria bacterium]
MVNPFKKSVSDKLAVPLIIILAVAVLLMMWWQLSLIYQPVIYLNGILPPPSAEEIKQSKKVSETIKQFASVDDFKKYLTLTQDLSSGSGVSGGIATLNARSEGMAVSAPSSDKAIATPARVSETNVQVLGIDEPDIVKTDGQNIYYSGQQLYYSKVQPMMAPVDSIRAMPPYQTPVGLTQIITAWPPTSLAKAGEIKQSGDLLVIKDKKILVVLADQKIFGFAVDNPQAPVEKWQISLAENTSLKTARLKDGKLYLITQNYINYNQPCPMPLLKLGEKSLVLPCTEIYHPITAVPTDVTFSILAIDPVSGQVDKKTAVTGSSAQSLVYMSNDNLYLTYSYQGDTVAFLLDFFQTTGQKTIPNEVLQKLVKLNSYDLSAPAKRLEMQAILEKYFNSLGADEKLQKQNDLANQLSVYYQANLRQTESTGIMKISLAKFTVMATGVVPGYPLNQFSLDEYQGNLRVATAIGNNGWWGFPVNVGSVKSTNDVYVLDGSLGILGAVKDLGLSERIYAVRFIAGQGYVVTFRQTDPFYVLDLSNPKAPRLSGELKIPGYSGYLHPLAEHKILGVGQEGSQVKLSLFDVSNPQAPQEVSKYLLNEYYSEAINNHHAFLQDEKKEVFFLPGGQGGYIFSYAKDQLQLTKAISGEAISRAVYLNDYLYLIGQQKIIVINEATWEKVKELAL